MQRLVFIEFLLVLFIAIVSTSFDVAAAQLPKVRIVSVQRIFDNGEHNAFTDLVRFRGKYYLTFRSCPDGHMVHPTSSIIILASDDAKSWRQVHRFHVDKRDTRDPHFLIFKEKLFVYTGTWYCGDGSPAASDYNINQHLGYAVWTEDGDAWGDPTMLEGTYGHYIWRAAVFGGKAFLCARRKHEFAELSDRSQKDRIMESAMLESDDGLIWKKRALFQEQDGDETAFLFQQDGSVIAVARRGGKNAELCRSQPPYKSWRRTDLGRYIGGPLLAEWGDFYLVGGRKRDENGYVTALYWLQDGRLFQFAELPSGGDNSYPGFLQLAPDKALVSYYSSHEKDENGKAITAIYMAELVKDKR